MGDGGSTTLSGGGGWANVDEIVADDDTTYMEAAADPSPILNNREDFLLEDPPDTAHGSITSVVVYVRARRSIGTDDVFANRTLRLGSNLESRLPEAALTNSYGTQSSTWTLTPNGAGSWTWDDIRAMQPGTNFFVGLTKSGTIRATQLWVEVNYTLSDWNVAPSNVFSFSGDADLALSDYLQDTTITHSDVSTIITFLEATVKDYQVTPLDFPTVKGPSLLPRVHIWTTQTRGPFEETTTTNALAQTRIIVWAENNDPESSADEVQAICGAIASALLQTVKTAGNDWAGFYANNGVDVGGAEIEFVADGEEAGFCRGELTVNWGHFSG